MKASEKILEAFKRGFSAGMEHQRSAGNYPNCKHAWEDYVEEATTRRGSDWLTEEDNLTTERNRLQAALDTEREVRDSADRSQQNLLAYALGRRGFEAPMSGADTTVRDIIRNLLGERDQLRAELTDMTELATRRRERNDEMQEDGRQLRVERDEAIRQRNEAHDELAAAKGEAKRCMDAEERMHATVADLMDSHAAAIAEAEERALKWADCHYVTCFGDIEKLDTKQRHLTKYWNKYFAAYRASKGESECKMSEKESEHSSVSCSLPAVSVSRSDCGNSQKSLSGSGVTSESSDCRASQQQQPDNSKIVCTSKFSVEDVVAVKDKAPYYQDMAVKRWDGGIVPFTIVGVSPGMQHDQRGYWLEAPGYGKKGDYGNGRIMVDSVDLMPIADVTPKQQPEHQPWCQSVQPSESMSRYCTCERRVHQQRDGKDRRAWLFANMRSVNERRVNFRRATYPNGQTHGRRSGETYADWYEQYKGDRRQG